MNIAIRSLSLIIFLFAAAMFFAFQAPAAAAETVIASLSFGPGDGQLGGFRHDAARDVLIPGPGAFACGPGGAVYLVDSSKFRVLKIDPANGKVSRLFSYDKTALGENYVSDIVVAANGDVLLYAEDERLFYLFSGGGKLLSTFGEEGERRPIRSLGGVFFTGSGAERKVKAFDRQETVVVTFTGDGSIARETAAEFSGTSFAVGPNGKFYHGYFDYSRFIVNNLEKTSEVILDYDITGRPDGLIVQKAYLVGIGPAMEIYLRLVLEDEKTAGRKNAIVKFLNSKLISEKIFDYYDPSQQNLFINKPFILMNDGSVVTYRITEKAYELIRITL